VIVFELSLYKKIFNNGVPQSKRFSSVPLMDLGIVSTKIRIKYVLT
jgi:hypothetical protein